jgi:hypothetical protein
MVRRGMNWARRVGGARGSNVAAAYGVPARKMFALTGFAVPSYMSTAAGGGEQGVDTGFGGAELFRLRSLGSAIQLIAERLGPGNTGYTLYLSGSNVLTLEVKSAAGTSSTCSQQLVASDVGRVILVAFQHTGSLVRMFVFRDPASTSDVAISGYAQPSNATTVGVRSGGTFPATTIEWLADAAWRGVPTTAQLRAYYDATRTLGDLPSTIDGATVTHRHSLRDQLLKLGAPVVDGQAAPAQLDDTVTGAAIDAEVTQGTGLKVRKIDPSIDGRTTKGVLGFGATAFLATAVGVGIQGSPAGLTALYAGRLEAATISTAKILAGCVNATSNRGWVLQQSSSTVVRLVVWNAAGAFTALEIPVSSADVGQPIAFGASFDGSVLRLQCARASGITTAAEDGKTSVLLAAGGGPMLVGSNNYAPAQQPADVWSWFELAGGHVALTPVEIAAALETWRTTGTFGNVSGKLEHGYKPTQDIAANNGELPAQFLDRIGTDHLARLDIDVPKVGPNGVRGVGPYAVTDEWQSAPGGGIVGVNTGFHVVADLYFSKVPTADEFLFSCTNVAGNAGYSLRVTSTGLLRGAIAGVNNSGTYQLTGADLNKRIRVELEKTATVIRLYVNGVQAGADVAAATYSVPTGVPMSVGNIRNGGPMLSGWVELVQGGHANHSAGERTTLNADLTQPAPIIAGKTEKRWRFHDDTAATPTKTPRTSVERVSGAAPDLLTRYGAGLQVAQRVEHPWSYETAPIMKAGASSGAGANRWAAPSGLDTAGDPLGFFVGVLARSRAATSGRFLSHSSGGPQGWNVNGTGGVQWSFTGVDGSATNRSAPAVIVAADGKARAALWVYDAPASLLRAYQNRAQVGSGNPCTGFTITGAGAIGLTLGSLYGGGSPNPDTDLIGIVYGLGVPTLAQFQAWEDATMALEDIVAIEGGTHMYSCKRGMSGLNLLDLIGSYNIPAVGAPAVTDIYARAWSR